uniref:Uncharacterized protein n=1 Tax=Oryza glumipatula TaxID=40148 RepID=A0A0E0A251_9ORYZ
MPTLTVTGGPQIPSPFLSEDKARTRSLATCTRNARKKKKKCCEAHHLSAARSSSSRRAQPTRVRSGRARCSSPASYTNKPTERARHSRTLARTHARELHTRRPRGGRGEGRGGERGEGKGGEANERGGGGGGGGGGSGGSGGVDREAEE